MAKTKSRLRTKLLFQYDTRSKDTDGFETPSWTDKGERYCQVEILRGREYWDAHAVLGSQGVIVRAHYDSTIAEVEPARWRMQNGSVVYNIVSMVNINLENKWLEFTCTVGTGVLD